MIHELEKTGKIKPGDKLVEATSGNTGVGLAMAAAVKGYDLTITLPEKMSNEKMDVIKGFGARVIRTPTQAPFDSEFSNIGVAKGMHSRNEAFFVNQYENPGNSLVHYDQTAEEIIEQVDGKLDAFIISVGTGGCVTGIGRKLKEKMPNCLIIGVDPHGSILAQPPELNNVQLESYKVEGIGYDFIPKVCDRSVVDKWYKSDDLSSFSYARKIIRREGMLVGGSAGSVLEGALRFVREKGWDKDPTKRVCMLLADNVRNYISKFLSKEWCVENKFIPYQELREQKHPMNGIPIEKLGLGLVKAYADITVGEAKALFVSGQKCIPLVEAGKLKKVILPNKLLQISMLRGLKSQDSALACGIKDFVHVPETIDCAILERIV